MQVEAVLLAVVGLLWTALLSIVGWLTAQAVTLLKEIVVHLRELNHRTEKLETRMSAEERR